MIQQTPHSDDRLIDLERQVRLLRRIGVAMLAAVFLSVVARRADTAERGTIVKAPFRVVDEKGKVLLMVQKQDRDGRPGLNLFNPDGVPVTSLGNGADGGVVMVSDNEGHPVAILAAGSREDSRKSPMGGLWIVDASGSNKIELFAESDRAGLRIHKDNKVTLSLTGP